MRLGSLWRGAACRAGGRDWLFGEIGAICQKLSRPRSHGIYNQRDVCERSLSQTFKGDEPEPLELVRWPLAV